ncbi:GGDEF domain-containing protein [Photobacterium sp. 1_MG-2023]|uniref:GGDEF domain-containing protein n=1 Tax=Photobacterium sp. 1_MG-2023 TaxID=3062646 RepID=UPI0026E224BB|nr:GGDEF domain-containing protein [Photobacterium sp. 1_MG-2023]MDO6705728.1 GGDEF domain-containing protein [Photobacterium sp. 1_MG-2023]
MSLDDSNVTHNGVTDDFLASTQTLRKTIPLMIKHKVPTTPVNYALWYSYTTNQIPMLNQAMDQCLEQYGHCPPSLSDSLYRTHLVQRPDSTQGQITHSLQAIMDELCHTMAGSRNDTHTFQQSLSRTCQRLSQKAAQGVNVHEANGLVQELLDESKTMHQSSALLHQQLEHAQLEIENLKKALKDSLKHANEDPLTLLLNRRAFQQDLNSCIQYQTPFSLILLDIDHFKIFNDDFGHLMGDKVLCSVARHLQAWCEQGMQAYRYGGEEFVVILPGADLQLARQKGEQLRQLISSIAVQDKQSGKTVRSITASMGVAEQAGKENGLAVLARADKYLLQAKNLGRNRVLPVS